MTAQVISLQERVALSTENPLSAGLDYMRQKRERTGTSYYKLPVTCGNLAYGGFARAQYERQSKRCCPTEPGADCSLTEHNREFKHACF